MADWASKANYNNPLFTIYHTLQFVKHKGMYWGKKEVYRLLRSRLASVCDVTAVRERFRYAFLRCFVTPCDIAKFCLHVLSHRHVLSPCDKTYRKIHSVHGLSLFSSNIVIHLSSSLDVCRCTWMHSRAVLFCVLLFPLQIMIKLNLFCFG